MRNCLKARDGLRSWLRGPALMAALSLPLAAQAVTLRVCVDQVSHFPLLTPELGGITGVLLKMAAAEVGVELTTIALPIARCREAMRADLADAFPVTPYMPQELSFLSYPMSKGRADPARAVVNVRNLVFRHRSTKAAWDGSTFSALASPVLVTFGASLIVEKLAGLSVRFDDNGKTPEVNFRKLVAGRGELLIAIDVDGAALLARPEFRDSGIEALPVPFTDEAYYLGISKVFSARHPGLAAKLWQAAAQIRQSPQFAAAMHDMLDQAAKAPKE